MSCRELDSFVLPYLDGELEATERADIERHLAECPACAKHVHSEAAFRDVLRSRVRQSLEGQRAPDALRERVRRGIRAERRRAGAVRWATGGAAAAAVAVVVAGSFWTLKQQQRDKLVHDAATRFYKQQLPFDLPAPGHAAAEAYSAAQLEHGVRLPQFQNAIVKGARVSNIVDKPAVLVAYDVPAPAGDVHRANLYVIDDSRGDVPAQRLPSLDLANERGVNVVIWRDDEIVYALTSDTQESDIRAWLKAKSGAPAIARIPDVATRPVNLDSVPASFPPGSWPTAAPLFQSMPSPGEFRPASYQPH
jgi:mycothiol system anti-sigma-R factor